MKDPAFLFYSSDFLTGVANLTMEERGQYITLMCLQHQHGHLSEKTIWLSLGLASVTEIPDVISKFKRDKQGFYYNERLEEEINKRSKYTDSRRSNGLKGGRPTQKSDKHMDKHMVNHMGNHSENENININKGGMGGNKLAKPTIEEIRDYCLERSNGIDAEHFFSYYEARGWVLNNGKTMKDWKSAIITWEKNNKQKQPSAAPKYKRIEVQG